MDLGDGLNNIPFCFYIDNYHDQSGSICMRVLFTLLNYMVVLHYHEMLLCYMKSLATKYFTYQYGSYGLSIQQWKDTYMRIGHLRS